MPQITITQSVDAMIEVSCKRCGEDMKVSLQSNSGVIFVGVDPCKKCMGAERKGGMFEGFYECMKTMEDK